MLATFLFVTFLGIFTMVSMMYRLGQRPANEAAPQVIGPDQTCNVVKVTEISNDY